MATAEVAVLSSMSKTDPPGLFNIFSSEDEQDCRDSDAEVESLEGGGDSEVRQAPFDDGAIGQSYWTCFQSWMPLQAFHNDQNSWMGCGHGAQVHESPEISTQEKSSKSPAPSRSAATISPTSTVYDMDVESGNDRNPTPAPKIVEPKIKLDDHRTTGKVDDGESIATTPTLGWNLFGELKSLPSVTDSKILNDYQPDEGSTIASVEDVSLVSIPIEMEEMPESLDTNEPLEDKSQRVHQPMTPDEDEDEVDVKLRNVNVEETIGKVRKSTASLIRTSSSKSSSSSFMRRMKHRRCKSDSSTSNRSISHQASGISGVSDRLKSKRAPLVRKLRETIEKHGRYDVRCGNITSKLGGLYEEDNEFDQSLKLYREAVTIYSTKLGDNHGTTMDSRIRMAKLLEKMGKYDESIDLYFHVLGMRKAICAEKDSSIPDTLTYLAIALKKKGRLAQAIKELKRALKLYRVALGDSHPRVTGTVDEISSLYIAFGDYEKATAILEEVVKLKAATWGTNTDVVAKTLLELATAYECSGQNSQALRSLKKSYSIFVAVKGEGSEEATNTLERIAVNYRANGDLEKAVAAYLGVLRGRKQCLGDAHQVVANTYLQLGVVLRESKQQDKAMKCFKQSLSTYVGEGKDMKDVGMIAEVMHEMALTHQSKGQPHEAQKIFKQELAIRQKMGERELPRVAVTLHHLGTTELEMGNTSKALRFFMEALTVYEKADEEAGVDFGETLYCLGIVFDLTRHGERAKEAYEEALKIFESKLSEGKVVELTIKLDNLRRASTKAESGTRPRTFGKRITL